VNVTVIIPTLNEAASIAQVISEIPNTKVQEIIVADSGSTDGTQNLATAAGARVVALTERGYGRACAAAAAAATGEILVFMDGDGADRADLIEKLIAPIRDNTNDFVLAARVKRLRAKNAMSLHQVLAGHLLGLAMFVVTGTRYTDMCAYRAIRRDTLLSLEMKEMTYGWNIEMQFLAARQKLRIAEIPLPYRCRTGGESKVAGSLRGTVQASARIMTTFFRIAMN